MLGPLTCPPAGICRISVQYAQGDRYAVALLGCPQFDGEAFQGKSIIEQKHSKTAPFVGN